MLTKLSGSPPVIDPLLSIDSAPKPTIINDPFLFLDSK